MDEDIKKLRASIDELRAVIGEYIVSVNPTVPSGL